MSSALPLAPSLSTANLSGVGLGDDAAVVLAAALPACRNLEALMVGNNCIADRGALAVAAALEQGACPKLTHLDLAGNRWVVGQV